MENNCYTFKEIIFDSGFLDDSCDVTYIVHLEGNGRLESIYNQLSIYQPTKKVIILFNKGYKKCNKKLKEYIPRYNLIDCYITIFNHAKKYNNILILEDDFIFSEKILDKTITYDINQFINMKDNESFVYFLGCLPYIRIPYDNNHNISLISIGTHACIYSKLIRNITLEYDFTDTIDWDNYLYKNYRKYMYDIPLCYQLFTATENYNNWYHFYGLTSIIKKINNNLELDKKVEPGYTYNYMFSKYIFYFFIICILVVIYSIINKIYYVNKQ
jgi:hypothetical protein